MVTEGLRMQPSHRLDPNCLVPPAGGVEPLPSTGMASDTCGSVAVTKLWKTVRERRMVTPGRDKDGKHVSERK